MLKLRKQIAVPQTEREKAILQNKINATDQQIDYLVYKLYRLTKEEVSIIEQANY